MAGSLGSNAVAAAGRSVIVPDLPAHGDSAPATAGVAGLVNALAALADGGPMDVVGYSLGARLAASKRRSCSRRRIRDSRGRPARRRA